MIKAIVVDDEQPVRNLLRMLLNEHCPDVDVVAQCNDLPEAVKAIRKHQPSLVFLDIEMPGHSGLELLDFFNEDEIDFHIIFTTAYSEYAVQAFDLSAVGYLVKPIKPEKLKETLDRYRKMERKSDSSLVHLKHNLHHPEKRITLSTKYKTYFINLTDIVCIKGDGAYSDFILVNNEHILVSKNLKHFEDILTPNPAFVRVSKQSIVNKLFVESIVKRGGYQVILKGDIQLAVSPDKEHLLHSL